MSKMCKFDRGSRSNNGGILGVGLTSVGLDLRPWRPSVSVFSLCTAIPVTFTERHRVSGI